MGDDFLEVLEVRDISVGGVGVCVMHRFEGIDAHQDIWLILSLPGESSMRIKGTIRHQRQVGAGGVLFGVQFDDLSRDHYDRIRAYVKRAALLSKARRAAQPEA